MATIFATLTVTAALVTVTVHDLTSVVTITKNKTTTAFDLHLFPPFAQATPTALSTTTTRNSTVLAYPYGPAPEAPLSSDPLGLASISRFYGAGPTILLLCLGLAATLQLCLPLQRATHVPHISLIHRRLIQPILNIPFLASWDTIRDVLQHAPILFLQLLSLIGPNLAAHDLLVHLIVLEQHWQNGTASPSAWTPSAGALGPPINVIIWGIIVSIPRLALCLRRLHKARPNLHVETPERGPARETTILMMRHLVLDFVGLALPSAALGLLATRWWLYRSAAKTSPLGSSPVDFMPAFFWDGMERSTHGFYVIWVALIGTWLFAMPTVVLLFQDNRLWERLSGLVVVVVLPIFMVPMVILLPLAVISIIATICSAISGYGDGLVTVLGEAIEWIYFRWMVFMSPLFFLLAVPAVTVMILPFIFLWYVLRGLVFGKIDTLRSCFFIPCTEWSIWGPDQLCMVIAGMVLVIYYLKEVKVCLKELPNSGEPLSEKSRGYQRPLREWVRRGAISWGRLGLANTG